jgi:hypothetical protein
MRSHTLDAQECLKDEMFFLNNLNRKLDKIRCLIELLILKLLNHTKKIM